jgi:hypothetical protein
LVAVAVSELLAVVASKLPAVAAFKFRDPDLGK